MRARQEAVDETRLRITEATMRLHETVGPAATTVSAIAEEAGVTRLTVYRHFPDDSRSSGPVPATGGRCTHALTRAVGRRSRTRWSGFGRR